MSTLNEKLKRCGSRMCVLILTVSSVTVNFWSLYGGTRGMRLSPEYLVMDVYDLVSVIKCPVYRSGISYHM